MSLSSVLDELRQILYKETGVLIKKEKNFLLENRLRKRIRESHLEDLNEYLSFLKQNSEEKAHFISTMTTHKTFFYRESFNLDKIDEFVNLKSDNDIFYIMCAACSTGEEAYSIASHLERMRSSKPFDYRILAFDICTESLETARNGVYINSRDKVLGSGYEEFFEFKNEDVHVKDVLKKKIKFRHMNLIDLNLPHNMVFDVIYARNVFIYFDESMISRALNSFQKVQKVGGKLILGLSEHVDHHQYSALGGSIYEKKVA